MILAGVIAMLCHLPLVKVDISLQAAGLVRPTTERANVRRPVVGHIAGVSSQDNERVRLEPPPLVIRSRDLQEHLGRNHGLQVEPADLVGDLHLLTTEPALVMDNPSGDSAKKGGIAGPLFAPSLLHGGSVVKSFLRTATRQRHLAWPQPWREPDIVKQVVTPK